MATDSGTNFKFRLYFWPFIIHIYHMLFSKSKMTIRKFILLENVANLLGVRLRDVMLYLCQASFFQYLYTAKLSFEDAMTGGFQARVAHEVGFREGRRSGSASMGPSSNHLNLWKNQNYKICNCILHISQLSMARSFVNVSSS